MALYPLSIQVTPGAWRLFATRKSDPKFADFRDKVLERDAYTCQYCGFQARQFQEVVNLDQNYRNNKLSNLITACVFCTQCLFLESVGQSDAGGGTLIYAPEITQPELDGLCHVLFCAIANATGYRSDAQAIYRSLKLRAQVVEDKMGEGMSNPAMIGKILLERQGGVDSQIKDNILRDLRLLPSRTKFREQIQTWAAAALEELASGT